MIADVAAGILMSAGALLMVGAALGTLRFPGPVARLHAATKAASVGLALLALGAGVVLGPGPAAMAAAVVVFQTLTAPISGHLLARAALAAVPANERDLVHDDLAVSPRESAPSTSPVAGRGHPALVVLLLAAGWVALWGDPTVANVAGGLLAAGAVMVLFRRRGPAARLRLRPFGALRFGAAFLIALVRGTLSVAREAFDPDDRSIRPAVVHIVLPGATRPSLILTANAVTLTPGSVAVEVDLDGPALLVHVLHFDGPEAVRRDVAGLHAVAASAVASPTEVPA
jgi:monovalent cation/proton antiporter MnhG/PhaG subunit